MSLYRYFSRSTTLPTPEQAELSDSVVAEANKAVDKLLVQLTSNRRTGPTKRKYTTTFTAESRATIGKYAAENGNIAACKKFKTSHGVGESTVRSLKKEILKTVEGTTEPGNRVGRGDKFASKEAR